MINKIKFNGVTLYRQRVKNNILAVYNNEEVDGSCTWYKDANIFASDLGSTYNVDIHSVSGIIAALSPLKSWTENKKIAELFLREGKIKHTKMMGQKAIDIKNYKGSNQLDFIKATLRGNKITSFYLNIAYPNNSNNVTIDRHAISICLGRSIKDTKGVGITDKQYEFFVSCYKEVAKDLNLIPCNLQSVTWEKWRKLK